MFKSVWNPILPKSVSRCDDRTASHDSGNRAEDNVPIQTLQSHLTPLCAGPHGYENLWIAMALYLVGGLRLKGGVNVVQLMDVHVFARGRLLDWCDFSHHFLRNCSLRFLLRLLYAKVLACFFFACT